MKKIILGMVFSSLLLPVSLEPGNEIKNKVNITRHAEYSAANSLYIYNCEDYIYEDEETQETMVDEFEKWYEEKTGKDIYVQYDCYDTNETMYNQVAKLNRHYDLVCASDYMLEKMHNEQLLEDFEPAKIPNYTNYVSPYIKDTFDKNGYSSFAVGYMWGTMGLIYNPETVAHEDVKTWDVLWDSKYENKISVKDSMRDTYMLGIFRNYSEVFKMLDRLLKDGKIDANYYNEQVNYFFNKCDEKTLEGVENALVSLKDNIYGFEVDSGKNDIVAGKIDINVAWSGDAVYSIYLAEEENNKELCYSIPEEGSNVWFDGLAMPKGANKELAQAFVDYISDPENAVKNMDYIGYTSTIAGDAVLEYIHDSYDAEDDETEFYDLSLDYFFGDTVDASADKTIHASASQEHGQLNAQFPSEEILMRCGMMHDFGDANDNVVAMWARARASKLSVTAIVFLIAIVVLAVGVGAYFIVKKTKSKKRRANRKLREAQNN